MVMPKTTLPTHTYTEQRASKTYTGTCTATSRQMRALGQSGLRQSLGGGAASGERLTPWDGTYSPRPPASLAESSPAPWLLLRENKRFALPLPRVKRILEKREQSYVWAQLKAQETAY